MGVSCPACPVGRNDRRPDRLPESWSTGRPSRYHRPAREDPLDLALGQALGRFARGDLAGLERSYDTQLDAMDDVVEELGRVVWAFLTDPSVAEPS